MNADDMNQPMFGSFYRPQARSKAVSFHITSPMEACRRESPANMAFPCIAQKIRIAQINRFARTAEPVFAAPVAAAAPAIAPPGKRLMSEPRSQLPDAPTPAGQAPG